MDDHWKLLGVFTNSIGTSDGQRKPPVAAGELVRGAYITPISALFGPSYIYFVVFFPSYFPLRHFLLNPIPTPISFPPSTSSSSHVTRARAPAHFPAAAMTNISQSFGQQPGPRVPHAGAKLTLLLLNAPPSYPSPAKRPRPHHPLLFPPCDAPSTILPIRGACIAFGRPFRAYPLSSPFVLLFVLPPPRFIPLSLPLLPSSHLSTVFDPRNAASSSLQQPLRFEARTHSHADLNHRTQFALGAVRVRASSPLVSLPPFFLLLFESFCPIPVIPAPILSCPPSASVSVRRFVRFVIRPDRKYLRLFADACRPLDRDGSTQRDPRVTHLSPQCPRRATRGW
ncbi:hypothetical protein C8J57DRAFT_1556960 [Mycena rebaudengoi]|nr:hypothetical protein C8J57DRAFT_1556960 [Mycena rebaudengoi]